jgi:corrinoid protein of di/trimethylamine methyltransferase
MEYKALLAALTDAIVTGEPEQASALAEQGLADKYDALALIEEGLKPGIDIVGRQFACGEMYLPDLVRGGEAMKAAIAALEPGLKAARQERSVAGRVVLGTVKGDIHEIGKTLVGTMLAANGFEVQDLGVDVPVDRFVEAAQAMQADLVGLSALLTTTMLRQRDVVQALREAGLRDRVKVVVGGAPTDPDWAEAVGADAYAENAVEAVRVARSLVENNEHSSRTGGKELNREDAKSAKGFIA